MDAVFSANDQMAISVIQIACQKNKRIPEDIGVVGFDNMPEVSIFLSPFDHSSIRAIHCWQSSCRRNDKNNWIGLGGSGNTFPGSDHVDPYINRKAEFIETYR